MSYILDALKRSQRERELGRVPGLGAEHLPAPGAISTRFGWAVAAGGLSGALLAGGALLAILRPWATVEPLTVHAPAADPKVEAEARRERSAAAVSPRTLHQAAEPTPLALAAPLQPVPAQPAPAQPAPARTPAWTVVDPAPAPVAAPLIQELPEPSRSRIPELRLNVHVYAENAAARFVFINNALYHEGQTTREGALVEAITPEGAILSYGGTRFRTHL